MDLWRAVNNCNHPFAKRLATFSCQKALLVENPHPRPIQLFAVAGSCSSSTLHPCIFHAGDLVEELHEHSADQARWVHKKRPEAKPAQKLSEYICKRRLRSCKQAKHIIYLYWDDPNIDGWCIAIPSSLCESPDNPPHVFVQVLGNIPGWSMKINLNLLWKGNTMMGTALKFRNLGLLLVGIIVSYSNLPRSPK